LFAVKRQGVFDGELHSLTELSGAIGMARDSPFSRLPVARGQRLQYLTQTVFVQQLRQLFFWIAVRERVLNRGESALGSRAKTINEVELSEKRREIGRELGH
jgi:hypothetical protein